MLRRIVIFSLALTLLVGAPVSLSVLQRSAESIRFTWRGPEECIESNRMAHDWRPNIINPDHQLELSFECQEHMLYVNVAQYFEQGPGKEAVGGGNSVAPRLHGRLVGHTVDSGSGFQVNEFQVAEEGDAGELVVWQWYGIGSNPIAGDRHAKLSEAIQVLRFRPTVSTVFLVAVSPRDDEILRRVTESLWGAYLVETQAPRLAGE